MNWTTVQLGELCSIRKGRKPSAIIDVPADDAVRILQIDDLRYGARPKYTLDKEGVMASPDDIIIAWDGANAGTVSYGLDGCIGSTLALLRPIVQSLHTPYIGRFLQSKFSYINSFSTGATIPHVNGELLRRISIPLPPFSEQQRIAALLDKADALRQQRRETITQLDSLHQSLFADLVQNWGQDWPYKPLAELVDEFRYGTSSKSSETGYPALRIPNVVGRAIDLKNIKTVQVSAEEFKRLQLRDGDVLFVRSNGNPDFIGRSAVFNRADIERAGYDPDGFIYASYLIRARVIRKLIEPEYLQAFLTSPAGRKALRSECRTSAGQYNINTVGLGSLMIPVAPLEIQRKLIRNLRRVQALQVLQIQSLKEMEVLFTSLQYRAFDGQLSASREQEESVLRGAGNGSLSPGVWVTGSVAGRPA